MTNPTESADPPSVDLCFQCGGEVRRVDGPGRTYRHRGVVYVLPDDLALATCQICGDRWLNEEDTRAITKAIEAQQAQAQRPVRAAG